MLLAVFMLPPFFVNAERIVCDPTKVSECKGSTNACEDEKISIEDGKVIFETSRPSTYTMCVEKQCTLAKQKAQQCWCGRETFDSALGKVSKESIWRCDPNLAKRVKAALAGSESPKNISGLFTQDQVAKIAAQGIPISDTTTISAVLRGAGVEGATKEVVDANPQAAYDLLQKIAAGDQSGAQEAASALGLNDDLGDVKALQASLPKALQDNISLEQIQRAFAQTGFQAPDSDLIDIERAKRAISCIESSCGNYGAVGPVTRNGDMAFGKYQVMARNIPSWTMQSCGRAYTAYEFRADADCQERVFETIFGGYVSSCGSYDGAALKWFSGTCYLRNANDGWLSTSGYLNKFRQYFASSATLPFGSQGRAYVGGQSAFANVTPFGETFFPDDYGGGSPFAAFTGSPTSAGYSGYSGGYTAPPIQPALYPVQPPQVPVPTTPPVPPPQAIATMVVQPKIVVRGNPVTVSWSSVGMSDSTQCEVKNGSTLIGQGNEGSKVVPTGTASPVGTTTYTLYCTDRSGQQIQRSASTVIN